MCGRGRGVTLMPSSLCRIRRAPDTHVLTPLPVAVTPCRVGLLVVLGTVGAVPATWPSLREVRLHRLGLVRALLVLFMQLRLCLVNVLDAERFQCEPPSRVQRNQVSVKRIPYRLCVARSVAAQHVRQAHLQQ